MTTDAPDARVRVFRNRIQLNAPFGFAVVSNIRPVQRNAEALACMGMTQY
jgi:hypothetical protein